ncbi:trehalase family glycosidase [Lewinella sp. W8]|uniref:MGH1-like glycoside hydrolase domain-containing protein n=1 Tax=Lewinella sp. W8 TaxID=2528208 RepID=UPI001067E903|nr:trehalase family glycosidase [Lewinella sp. W8]MTB50177.1 glycoside hydrolase [Lewinella sp. W8]
MAELRRRAHEILRGNWRGGFTVPTARLYPFQWNWDSGFVSLGVADRAPLEAIEELENLFRGQWANGMVPHIVFHSETETTYFPNHDFWAAAEVNAGAPRKPRTSGISQPPVHGFVLEYLYERYGHLPDVVDGIRRLFPKVLASHRFFYQYRDPEGEGLVFLYHPWESGRDNSPIWDESLQRITISPGDIPPYERKDTAHADSDQRPTGRDYDRYVYLLELGKRHGYDGPGIWEESPFLLQDVMLNAILIRANEGLIRIGRQLGFSVEEAETWQKRSVPAFNHKLWDETLGTYVSWDVRGQVPVRSREVGGFVALFAGVPDDRRAQRMEQYLRDLRERGFRLCPSYDPEDPLFDSARYWRGPIWPQMNWLLHHGLLRYGFKSTAETVRRDLLDLVDRLGFHEYFEPQRAVADQQTRGYGGDNFSWTASTVLDFLREG